MTVADRFQAKIDMRGSCWLWMGAKTVKGYGSFNDGGHTRQAHRVAYELSYGPVPDGLEIDHTCGNRSCVNPQHLEAVTHSENLRRGAARRTHCKYGHEFTPENTYVKRNGARECRICKRRLRRRWFSKRLAQPSPSAVGPGTEVYD